MLPRKIGATFAPCRQPVSPGQRREDKPWDEGATGRRQQRRPGSGAASAGPPWRDAGGHPSALRGITFLQRQGRGVINSAALPPFARMFHELCTNPAKGKACCPTSRFPEPALHHHVRDSGQGSNRRPVSTKLHAQQIQPTLAPNCDRPTAETRGGPGSGRAETTSREVATVPPARFTLITSRAKGHAAGRRILTGSFFRQIRAQPGIVSHLQRVGSRIPSISGARLDAWQRCIRQGVQVLTIHMDPSTRMPGNVGLPQSTG